LRGGEGGGGGGEEEEEEELPSLMQLPIREWRNAVQRVAHFPICPPVIWKDHLSVNASDL
jgi:hypothetical protein